MSTSGSNVDASDPQSSLCNGGVAAYKEFSDSRHHELILAPSCVMDSSKEARVAKSNEKIGTKGSTSAISKLGSGSCTSINNVLKKAVVATKSWAGDGGSSANARVISTRSFSTGLSCLIDGPDLAIHNTDENGSPRPFMFDPKPYGDDLEEDDTEMTHHSSLDAVQLGNMSHRSLQLMTGRKESLSCASSSGPTSLDTGITRPYNTSHSRATNVALDGVRRSYTNLQSPHDNSMAANISRANAMNVASVSNSKSVLCNQCYVHNVNNTYRKGGCHPSHYPVYPEPCGCDDSRFLYRGDHGKWPHNSVPRCCHGTPDHHHGFYSTNSPRVHGHMDQCCGSYVVPKTGSTWQNCSSRVPAKKPVVRCSSGSAVMMCRCNSEARLPVRQQHRDTSLHDLTSSTHSCNACYENQLRASSSSCLYKYDDYVEYTESPYASHSPYVNQSPYTTHFDTPPLSSSSPPIASSPSHSYYSPSDSYTTPTENIRANGTAEESVFAALQSLNNIQNYANGHHHRQQLMNGMSYSAGLSSSRYELVCNSPGDCGCDDDGCGEDVCVDPCKDSCGDHFCCTAIRGGVPHAPPPLSGSGGSSGLPSLSSQGLGAVQSACKQSRASPNMDVYGKPYYQQHRSNKLKECHPNWKSTESSQGVSVASPVPKVSSSRSEGLLCTEL